MSVSYQPPSAPSSFWILSRAFAFCPGARFTGLLDPDFFQSHADRHRVRFGVGQGDTFDPAVTLWAWLSQVLSPAKSCAAAVSRVMALCYGIGRAIICSAATGAFCKARAKLPEGFLRESTVSLGRRVEDNAPASWKWRGGRRVILADGMLLQMLDSKENLQEYPQQRCQKPGTSYTCMRVVALLALATGVLLDAACAAYKGGGTGEISLLLSMLGSLAASDVLVGDRCYDCYLLLALLKGKGADGCFRLNVKRQGSFGQGQRLGEGDFLQTWSKPSRPRTIDKQTWDSLPQEITVRVLRFAVSQRGFRTKEVYVVTTLLDAEVFSKADIADLYYRRWNVEVDVRSLKQGLGLKMLACKTPEMVGAELWVHLLGYNLTRCVMAQAAFDKGLLPRQVSFTAARDTLNAFRWLLTCCAERDPELMRQVIGTALSARRVGDRPGRYEPREIKRRQRKYKELKKPRQQRRGELEQEEEREQGQEEKKTKRRKGGGKDRASGR